MTATDRAVTINGKVEELPMGLTIAQLLAAREIHTTLVVVELNGRILQLDEFERVTIAAGDRLEIVHFVGGG